MIEVVEPAGSDTFVVTQLGGKEVVARLRADADVAAGPDDAARLQPDKAVFFDPATENAHRLTAMADIPTSSSSAPASAARRSPPAWPAAAPRSLILERGEQLADSAGRRATRARSSATAISARRRLARRRAARLQSRQLLLCRRQLEILRRGADPLPQRGFRGHGACRRRLAGLAVFL